MQKIIDQLEHVFHLTDRHASQSQLSVFTFGKQALDHFVAMVVRDVCQAFTHVDSFVQDYELVYGQRRISLLQELDGIVAKLITIFDITELRDDPEHERLEARVTELALACKDAKDLIDGILKEDEIYKYNTYLTYLPSNFFISKVTKKKCEQLLNDTREYVNDVCNQMEEEEYLETTTFKLASLIKMNINRLRKCINEIGGALSSAKEWFEKNEFAKNNTAAILDYEMNFDYNTTLAPLSDTIAMYKAKLHDLAEHKITKLKLADYIVKDGIEQIEGFIKTTQATIKKESYIILENALKKVEKESISTYHDVMSHLSRIQQYYTKGNQVLADQAREMYIFYEPYIFEDSFGSIEYTLKSVTDTYEIWPLNKDFKKFVEKEARDHLTTLVKNYFRPVHEAMSKVMEDITDSGDAAADSLHDFMKSLALYAKSSRIDKDFIQ